MLKILLCLKLFPYVVEFLVLVSKTFVKVNGVLPSCSGMENVKMEDATLHNDDISHPRILMRITRKNNVVSLADPQSNHNSLQKESSKGDCSKYKIFLVSLCTFIYMIYITSLHFFFFRDRISRRFNLPACTLNATDS